MDNENEMDQKEDINKGQRRLFTRLLVAFSVNFLSFVAIYIQVYCQNEWVQERVKVSMFGNETLTSSSACSNSTDPDYAKLAHVQQETAKWSMYCTMTVKSVSLVTTFLFTVYTDVYGRRFLFVLSCLSIALFCLCSALVYLFEMDFVYLILNNLLYAITGTSYGILSVTYSYVADVTEAGKERNFALFCADVSLSLAGTAGTFIAGEYIERTGFVYPSFTAAGISGLALLIALFCIPESLKPENRISRPNILDSITTPFKFYFKKGFTDSRVLSCLLFMAFIFADVASVHRSSIETLYQLGMPFCWPASKIGLFATAKALAANIFGVAGLKALGVCMTSVSIALLSTITTAGSLILEAMATTEITLFLVVIPACLSNLPSPLIRSTLSAMASKHQQGALSAGLLLVQTICSFVTGIVDNSVYAATVSFYNGFVFFVFAGYCFIAAVFLAIYLQLRTKKMSGVQELNNTDDTVSPPGETLYSNANHTPYSVSTPDEKPEPR